MDIAVTGVACQLAGVLDSSSALADAASPNPSFMALMQACLSDAGLARPQLQGRKVGVVFDPMASALFDQGEAATFAPHVHPRAHGGIVHAVVRYLGLSEQDAAVGLVCADAHHALHTAAQAIERGDCDMVLLGASDALLSAHHGARGEGVVVLMLKAQSRAQAEGALIRGVVAGQQIKLSPPDSSLSPGLYPLIDVDVSTPDEQVFCKTLRAEEFVVRDHRLGDNRVLPAVAYLEMVLQACRLGGHAASALSDVSWLKAIVVNEGSQAVYVSLTRQGAGLHFEVFRLQEGGRVVHAKGAVVLRGDHASEPSPALIRAADIHALKARCKAWSEAEALRVFDGMGAAWGPSYQVMASLHCNEVESCARLTASRQADVRQGHWTLHPTVLDGVVRTALGIGDFGQDLRLRVPVRLERLTWYQPVVGDCEVLAVPTKGAVARHGRASYDLTLFNASGEVLAELKALMLMTAPQLASKAASPGDECTTGTPTPVATRSPA